MAEQKFTEAGKAGQKFRSALSSAYGATKSGVKSLGRKAKLGYDYLNDIITEYGQEPLLNLYPQSVNLVSAATEFGAGVAGIPTSLGRYPYYDRPTQFDKQSQVSAEPKAIEEKKAEVKEITSSAPKAETKIWRVMLDGGDPSQDQFYGSEKAAKDALNKEQARRKAERDYLVQTIGEKEANKRLGKEKKNIGAIAGIKFPAKTETEEEYLRDQYMQNARIGGITAQPKSREDVLRSKLEGMGATKEQQDKYFQNLERLSSGRKERELASKERASKFRSDIAAKEAGIEQLNIYNKQLSSLKKAYNQAGEYGDYVEQYRIGDFINSYTAGVPEEMGARQKAAERGYFQNKNKELEEKIRRDREAKIAAERASRANPDYYQFNSQPTYQPTSYQEPFANNINFSKL